MQTRINALYLSKRGLQKIDIFGYASRGMPGIELVGLGKCCKLIREKFVYISRERNLQIPLKRYVLCVENLNTSEMAASANGKGLDIEDGAAWLELPLILIFWHLAGLLPVESLDNCLAGGRVSVDGVITLLEVSSVALLALLRKEGEGRTSALVSTKLFMSRVGYILTTSRATMAVSAQIQLISVEALLNDFADLSFEVFHYQPRSVAAVL
ncbi:MAG: hypothetical protein HQK53_08905 [Oligoflexia bacterium]|nr:hypothetical protein [Oligoflexia bacterium]